MDRAAAYAHLGLPPTASSELVRQAYRRAAQRWHPDRHPHDAQAQDRFVVIQAAYRLLLTPAPSKAPPRPAPVVRLPGDDLKVRLLVPLASVFTEQHGTVRVRVAQVCPRCGGLQVECTVCRGSGQRFVQRALEVTVPAGAVPGYLIRLAGQGHMGPHFTEPGDVCVEVVWRRRGPWHYRDGRLERRIHLPRRIQQKGGTWRLRTPEGRRGTITLPPLPRHHWIAIPDQGLPLPEGGRAPLWLWVL